MMHHAANTTIDRRANFLTPSHELREHCHMTQTAPRRRIVLFGLFGVGNLGNDATLLVTLQELRRRLGPAEVICACTALPPSAESYDVKPVSLDPLPPKGVWRISNRLLRYVYCSVAYILTEPWRRHRMLEQLEGTDELIVVGTGVLDDFGMLPWDLPAWIFRWTRYARHAGATVKLLAVGAGPIRNRLNRPLMIHSVRMSQLRTYRDTVSRDFLAKHGIDTQHDSIVPDVVFGISEEHLPAPVEQVGQPDCVGVGVMGYYGWRNEQSLGEETYQAYVRRLAPFVSWLLDKGYAVRLLVGEIPTDQRAVQDIINAVADISGTAPTNLSAPSIESLDDLLRAITGCKAVVASRYHNVICALRLGKPVLALGYAEKFSALMGDVGLAQYCRDIEEFDPSELESLFLEMMNNRTELEASVRQSIQEYRQAVTDVFDLTLGPG